MDFILLIQSIQNHCALKSHKYFKLEYSNEYCDFIPFFKKPRRNTLLLEVTWVRKKNPIIIKLKSLKDFSFFILLKC